MFVVAGLEIDRAKRSKFGAQRSEIISGELIQNRLTEMPGLTEGLGCNTRAP